MKEEINAIVHETQRVVEEHGWVSAVRQVVELGDRSLTVHACHSPMREVEVLHDQLLAMFDAEVPDVRVRLAVLEFRFHVYL